MAILQAARARVLGLPEDSAFSWGLNRAIFYAAAKKGFKGTTRHAVELGKAEISKNEYLLGDEKAYTDAKTSKRAGKPYFTIGGETQSVEDFKKQIEARFVNERDFKKAWNEALKIIRTFDEETLKSQKEFYGRVYKPRRDQLSKTWSQLFAAEEKTEVSVPK